MWEKVSTSVQWANCLHGVQYGRKNIRSGHTEAIGWRVSTFKSILIGALGCVAVGFAVNGSLNDNPSESASTTPSILPPLTPDPDPLKLIPKTVLVLKLKPNTALIKHAIDYNQIKLIIEQKDSAAFNKYVAEGNARVVRNTPIEYFFLNTCEANYCQIRKVGTTETYVVDPNAIIKVER
jgi:hypothetical protein